MKATHQKIDWKNNADIIKIKIILIKTTLKNSVKLKIIRGYILKRNFYLCFPMQQKLLISGENMLMSAELKGCAR